MIEEWRKIVDFPDYEVSSLGRVKRVVPGRRNHKTGFLKPWLNRKGYLIVDLIPTAGRRKHKLVSRLVCRAFWGDPIPGKTDAAHGDGNQLNNRKHNLRWASRSENMEDSRRHGTMALGERHGRTTKPHRTPRGEKHGHAKLTERQVKAIRRARVYPGSGRVLAGKYGISPSIICMIRSRKIWNHL